MVSFSIRLIRLLIRGGGFAPHQAGDQAALFALQASLRNLDSVPHSRAPRCHYGIVFRFFRRFNVSNSPKSS